VYQPAIEADHPGPLGCATSTYPVNQLFIPYEVYTFKCYKGGYYIYLQQYLCLLTVGMFYNTHFVMTDC
jgi:hypothetical protein